MRNYLIVSLAALACAGCASNRMDSHGLSTANGRFSIAKDPILRAKPRKPVVGASTGSLDAAAQSAPTLSKFLIKYYEASAVAELREKNDKDPTPGSDYAKTLINYRSAGFDASRGICEYALNLMGEAHADYRFMNKSVSVASGGVSSLMGIFSASARSVSIYATGSALFQAWSQDFEEYAYLTASVGTMKDKVKAAQDTYRNGVEDLPPEATKSGPKGKYDVTIPKSWANATLQIQQYNSYCLATGMRGLVEKAVGKSEVYFDKKSGTVEFFSAQNLQELQFAIQQKTRAAVVQELQDAQKRVDAAYAAQQASYQKYNAAEKVVASYRGAYYDTVKKTVDLAGARGALQAATTAAADPNATQAQKDALKPAQDAVDQALALTSALADVTQYEQTGAAAAKKAVTDANTARDAVQAKLNEPATPPPA
jgi:hypothetical protein